MSVFAEAIDDLFADPNLAVDAVFLPEGGEPVSVRVIARRPDRVIEFGDARLHADTAVFEVRTSQVRNHGRATAWRWAASTSSSKASRCATASGSSGPSK